MESVKTIGKLSKDFVGTVQQFRSEMKIVTIGAFATIFTWGFIQALKKTILTPVIQAYIIPASTDRMEFKLKGKRRMLVGEFVAELIQWLIFMCLLFLIWGVVNWSTLKKS